MTTAAILGAARAEMPGRAWRDRAWRDRAGQTGPGEKGKEPAS